MLPLSTENNDQQAVNSTPANNKRIAKNTLMLYFRQILILLVALYTSRVLLRVLGVSDYGVYNVVGGVVTLFGFFNSAMVSATQRFMSYDIGRGDNIRLRITFNATQVIHFGLAVFIFILAETIGLWFVKTYLVIPPDRLHAALWVYHFAVLSFMVTVIQIPYNALVIAEERMGVFAIISILDALFKLTIVVVLPFLTSFDPLAAYGVMLFVVSLMVASIYRIYVQRNFPASKFFHVRDKNYYMILLSYSGWNIFGNLAGVLKGQGINMLMNVFFGPVVNAAQAVAYQVSSALNSFYFNFQLASKPQIIKTFATNEMSQHISLIHRTSKFSYFLLLIMTIPVYLEIEILLKLWLVTPPTYSSLFIHLVLVNSLIDSVSGPLMASIQATGKIKVYQAAVGCLLILNLPISYMFYKLGYSPESTYIISIAISIIALLFRILLTNKYIANFSITDFYNSVILRCLIVTVVSVFPSLLLYLSIQEGVVRLLCVTLCSLVVSALSVFFLGSTTSERIYLKQVFLNYFRKFR